jgi:hypothetical protein
MKRVQEVIGACGVLVASLVFAASATSAQDKKPNILVIMGDDVGWFNVGAYHQGIVSGKPRRRSKCTKVTNVPGSNQISSRSPYPTKGENP